MNAQSVIYEDEQKQLAEICQRLLREALAKAIFLLDRNGQVIVSIGEIAEIDVTSLASLVAGTTAATSSLAKLLGEPEFPVHFHEGKRDHLHISLAGEEFILTVIFDQRSSLGLVRLRVKKTTERLLEAFLAMEERRRLPAPKGAGLFDEITDDDIDNLFGDGF
jgi:predicted regulator of Ras-like GTPase activity (Roadblock/LC7/MglB family)